MSASAIVFAGCAIACLIGHIAILRSVLRTAAAQPADAGVPRPRIGIEVVWAVLPMLALALVLTATWAKVRAADTPRPEVLLEVAR